MHKYQNGSNIIAIILFCTLGLPWNCFGGSGANTPNKSSITVGSKNTILIEKEKAVIKAEEIYRNEIRKKIEKESNGPVWLSKLSKTVNAPITIWLLTTVVIGGFGLLYKKIKNRKENSEIIWQLDMEIASRIAYFDELVDQEKPKTFSQYHRFLSLLREDTPASRVFECFRGRTTSSMMLELSKRVRKKEKESINPALESFRYIARYNPNSNVPIEDLLGVLRKIKLDRWK